MLRILNLVVAVTIGSLAAASLMAAPILPHAANFSATPVTGARIGVGARVGTARTRGSSNVAPALIGVGVLAVLGGVAGIAAATSGHGGGNNSVSP